MKNPVPPSYSTFVNHTTTRPGVFNVAGKQILEPRDFNHTGTRKTFGLSLDQTNGATLKMTSQSKLTKFGIGTYQ